MTGVVTTWGSSPAERRDSYPCDALVVGRTWACFRAVDVAAPPEHLFRWLCQMRVAPYSYDLIDNLGRRSPRELTPGLETIAVGDPMMTVFRVAALEPGRQITIVLGRLRGRGAALLGVVFVPSALTYRVVARGPGASRLVVKYVSSDPPGLHGLLLRALLPLGDLLMMRRQLLTFRALAERDARRARAVAATGGRSA